MKSTFLFPIVASCFGESWGALISSQTDVRFKRKGLTYLSSALQMSTLPFFAKESKESDSSEKRAAVNGAYGSTIDISVYEKLGINEPDLALGINADELLQHVGTRTDLIEKCMRDITVFDRDRATKEVDKFLMDSEMVNTLIVFNKKYPNGIQEDNRLGNIWRTYATWFLAGFALIYIKNTFIMPKVESGEWKLPFGLFEPTSVVNDLITNSDGTLETVSGVVNGLGGSM